MINPFSDPSYLLSPLVALVASFILIIVVLSWGQRGFNSWIFCGLLLSVGLWGFLIFGMRSSPDVQRAVIWSRVAAVPAVATFVLYYHFTLTYSNARGQKGFLLASYLLLVIVTAFIPTDLVIKGIRLADYGYAPIQGPLSLPLSIATLPLLGGGVYNLLRRYKASTSYEERNRLLYLVIAILFPVLGALLDVLTNLPPALIWSQVMFCTVCSVAILKHHLLDIRIVLRKSLAYLLISVVVATPYVAVLLSLSQVINTNIGLWWMHALIILLLATILRPLHSWAQNLVDRLFYRDRYDYLRALERFSQETQSIANLKELGDRMVQLVSRALRASSICLLLPSESKHGLGVISCTGLERRTSRIVLSNSSPLIKWLDLHGDIVTSEQLSTIPQLQSFSLKERNKLERMRAELYVPMKTRQGQLSGILILGPKLSQQSYSNEERQLLTTLAGQMAMALENARLYDSEKTMLMELEKLDAQKTEFLHSIAHELKTPLTAIISSSEILSEDSPTSHKLRERLITNIRTSAESMDRRVTELLNLAQMQIGEPMIEPEPLEMNRAITEVASQLRILFEEKEQTLTFEIPDSLSRVNADGGKLEQVLFNLLSNANKFSPIGSDIILRARRVDRRIIVEVEDSAPAVTEKEKEKLFDPYYRGEDSDRRKRLPGIGLGLAISKKLVELHGGEIWVESKPGKGNTFAFSLPVLDQRTNGIK